MIFCDFDSFDHFSENPFLDPIWKFVQMKVFDFQLNIRRGLWESAKSHRRRSITLDGICIWLSDGLKFESYHWVSFELLLRKLIMWCCFEMGYFFRKPSDGSILNVFALRHFWLIFDPFYAYFFDSVLTRFWWTGFDENKNSETDFHKKLQSIRSQVHILNWF